MKFLTERFEQIKTLYPDIKLLTREQIVLLEPMVIQDRDPQEEIIAVSSKEGYAIDFGALCASFVAEAKHYTNKKIDTLTGTNVQHIEKKHDYYIVVLDNSTTLRAKTVVVSA